MSLRDMQVQLLEDYKAKFKSLEEIAFELHKIKEHEIEKMVIHKAAGLRLMIDHLKNILNF